MTRTSPSELRIRHARPEEYARVASAYTAWGYHGGMLPTDVVLIAERNENLVGIVRRTVEHGITMLRGMHVDPAHHRERIGSALLAAFAAELPDTECTCVPYRYLDGFYGRIGFAVLDESDAPAFVRARLERYRAEGRDMIVMRRPRSEGRR